MRLPGRSLPPFSFWEALLVGSLKQERPLVCWTASVLQPVVVAFSGDKSLVPLPYFSCNTELLLLYVGELPPLFHNQEITIALAGAPAHLVNRLVSEGCRRSPSPVAEACWSWYLLVRIIQYRYPISKRWGTMKIWWIHTTQCNSKISSFSIPL